MPKLGDYLGQLLSEVTIARMQADLEAVRIAELYASHPLLRHMPVPRFRVPDVDLDVPVVIKKMEETEAGKPPRGAPSLADMRKAFDKVLAREVAKEKISLRPEHKTRIKSMLDDKEAVFSQSTEVGVDVRRIAEGFADAISETLKEPGRPGGPIKHEQVKRLETRLKEAATAEFNTLRQPPPRLHILATTAEIREAGPSEVITRLRLKVTEDAFEWSVVESDEGKKERLVPE